VVRMEMKRQTYTLGIRRLNLVRVTPMLREEKFLNL
jgi:hypothetical protein